MYLDSFDVTNSNPLLDIARRKPVMNKSRNIINPTIQKSIISITANDMNVDTTNTLSARGSRNFPSGVT